jgi:hypothetical protein
MLRGHAGRESNSNMNLKNGCLRQTNARSWFVASAQRSQQLQNEFARDCTFVSTHLPAMVMYATQMPKTVANTKKSTTMIIQGYVFAATLPKNIQFACQPDRKALDCGITQ